MSNIHSILPLLSDSSWKWDKRELVDEAVPAGRNKTIFGDPINPGFLYYGIVTIRGEGGEKSEVEIDIDTYNLKTTIEESYNLGSVTPGSAAPGITRYDTDVNLFTIVYQPSPPLAYLDNLSIDISAPSNRSIRVDSNALKLDILDETEFANSYQRFTGGRLADAIEDFNKEIARTNDNLESIVDRLERDIL